jgi:hypothetical protein
MHTFTAPLPSGSSPDKISKITDKKQNGRPFSGGRPLLETGMLFQDGSGHLTHVRIDGHCRTFGFGSDLEYLGHAFRS